MITIQLQLCHNRRTGETTLSRVNNGHQTPVTQNSSLAPILAEPLSQWLEPNDQWPGFFAMIRKYYGTSGFAITFIGEEEDCQLLEQARDQYAPELHMSVELTFRDPEEAPPVTGTEGQEAEAALAELQKERKTLQLELTRLQCLAVPLKQICNFSYDEQQLLAAQSSLKCKLRTNGRFSFPKEAIHSTTDSRGITHEYILRSHMDDYITPQVHVLREVYDDNAFAFADLLRRTIQDPLDALLDKYRSTLTRLDMDAAYSLKKPSVSGPTYFPLAVKWSRLEPSIQYIRRSLPFIGDTYVAYASLPNLFEDLLAPVSAAFDEATQTALTNVQKVLTSTQQQAKGILKTLDDRIQALQQQISDLNKLIRSSERKDI